MTKIIYAFILLCFVAAQAHLKFPLKTFSDSSNDTQKEKIIYQLPKDVVSPIKYNLIFTPYLDETSDRNFTFDGVAEIELNVTKSTKSIILHAANLTFEKTDVILKKGEINIPIEKLEKDDIKDFVNITFQSPLTDLFTLKIVYKGILHNDMRGFYRSSYINEKGKKVWLATTHFEPVGARRAFPCFDEPAYKAVFDVKIIHDAEYTAISNAKKLNETPKDGKIQTTFEKTPPMSTYLLAFVVSDYKNISNSAKNFTVHTKPTAINTGILALETGEKLLTALENFTNITFEVGKMDQIAIPDFAAGAMENWGLVTYREKSLLYDEKLSTTSEKQNIIETIAHEFAHQWFGDLVSPKWWKYLWLNEGFATFFQSYITEQVDPEWSSVYRSVVTSIQTTAFNVDSGATTHPINQDVESPNEISKIFDGISYQKGGAVIRMMQHFLTEPIFQKGLQNYLRKNNHSAAESDDIFSAIDETAKEEKLHFEAELKTIMDSWVNKKGYPILTVTRNYNTNEKNVEIKQERFFSYNPSEEEKNNKYYWYIPINNATQDKPDFNRTTPDIWLKSPTDNITINVDPKHWLIINKQQTGFYRVNYDEANWKLIIDYLQTSDREKIHVLNRAQLVNDALAFVQQGALSLTTLLHLSSYLKNETDTIAWYPAFKTLAWLRSKLINTDHYPIFQEYTLNLTSKLVDSIGFEEKKEDKYLTKLSRPTLINWSCTLGNPACTSKMHEKLIAWINDKKNTISPDLQVVTFCHGLQNANFTVWNKTLEMYNQTTNSDEKKRILAGLGCSSNENILTYYLNYTLTDNATVDDTLGVIYNVLSNSKIGVDIALDFAIEKFPSILLKYMDKDRMVELFKTIGHKITTSTQLQKLKESELRDIPLKITKKGIEEAENNLKWLSNREKEIKLWKSEFQKNGVGLSTASLGLITSLLVIIFASNQ